MKPTPPPSRPPRLLLHLLVACGGVAALSWEVLWQLEASLSLGVSARGTAITLAATMLGLAVGSLVAGHRLRAGTPLPPVRLYGVLEGVIGAAGLLMRPGFRLLEALDSRVYGVSPALAPVLHAAGIVLLLGPPTLAMGATVPVFAHVARRHGLSLAGLYGMNTLGAAAGVLLIAFGLIPSLGVARTSFVVAGINLSIALVAWSVSPGPAVAPRFEERAERAPGTPSLGLRAAALVVFCTGFATFALEVAWFRSLRAAFHSITDSFAIMLVAVLLPLGVGARLVPRLRRTALSPLTILGAAAVAVLLATPLVERMDVLTWAWSDYDGESYLLTLLKRQVLCLSALGPAMLLLGIVLPWLLEEFGDAARCGRLYGLNTAGSVAGALGAAWLLLPTLGFARTAWCAGGLLLAVTALLHRGRPRLVSLLAGAGSLALAVALTSSPGRDRVPGTSASLDLEILAYDEGPDGTAAVVGDRQQDARALVIDGFIATQEGTGGVRYMDLMGRLPMLLHPDPKRALVICFGTGQTANAVREEGPEALDVVELNPAVLGMAHLFPSNRDVLEDPIVEAVAMDGRAWLRRTDRRYDVITLEPMPPFFAGVNALYSRDFYEIAARRLQPGGIVCQWLPIHLLPPFHSAAVVATFHEVFPDSALWIDSEATGILVGRRAGGDEPIGSSWPGLARAAAHRPLPPEELEAGLVLAPPALARYARLGTVITDDNQLLAYGSLRRELAAFGRATVDVNGDVIRAIAAGRTLARLPAPPP